MFIWIWIAVACGVLLLWLQKKYRYFKERQVNHMTPWQSFVSIYRLLSKQEHFSVNLDNTYQCFPNDRFIGTYEMFTPVLLIRDPELIRQIGVKDFDHFQDHRDVLNQNDPLFSKMLLVLKGQIWRDMRSTLSPAFTGSKLRNMVPLISESNQDLLSYLETQTNDTPDKHLDMDVTNLLRRYTIDVIATCAFGLKTNSIKEKDNEFYKYAEKLVNFQTSQVVKVLLLMFFPAITRVVDVNIFPKDSLTFLTSIILSALKQRDENNSYRPDMIQLLLEAKKGTLTHEQDVIDKDAGFATVDESHIGKGKVKQGWDDSYLVAQAFLFFFAGMETIAATLKFLLYELAVNTEVQERLRKEIDEHYERHDGKIQYDTINQIKYLDMVISETLRKWPPSFVMDRQCKNRYNLGKPNDNAEKDYFIEKGQIINISIWSLHHDPKHYENPDKFDPERFSDENKHKIKPFTYIPFGIGPRNCIGSRFALVEVKVMVYGFLRNFEVSPSAQTKIPARFDPSSFTINFEGGHWLRFTSRN